MPSDSPEVLDLVARLIRRTIEPGLPWGQVGGTAYALAGSRGTVVVTSSTTEGEHPYELTLLDGEGRELHRSKTARGEFYTSREELVAELLKTIHDSIYDVKGTIEAITDEFQL
jgi:hypothetical protein